MMENAEEVFHFLEEFSKRKTKTIPQELNDYLAYVARTGDPVYQWSLVKSLFKEKLINVITDFYETTPSIEIPPCPNVDPFNYDIMKNNLIEKLDTFNSAPFTVQRICELLTFPRKQYNRVDKFMRAIEKNILVVSTREPGYQRHQEPENGEPMEPIVNGSDNNSDYNVDVEMEDISWKDTSDSRRNLEPQPGSSDAHISVDDIEARLNAKQESTATQNKGTTIYESVTPPEFNIPENTEESAEKPHDTTITVVASTSEDIKNNNSTIVAPSDDVKTDVEMKCEEPSQAIIIPEIKVDDADMTEQKLKEQTKAAETLEEDIKNQNCDTAPSQISTDESSSDSTSKEETDIKHISEMSSSEESSSSSDNNDGNSNSPNVEEQVDVQEESEKKSIETPENIEHNPVNEDNLKMTSENISTPVKIQSDNYSISDVNSELPQTSISHEEEKIEKLNEQDSEKETIKEEVKQDNLVTNTDTTES